MRLKELTKHIFESRVKYAQPTILEDTELFEVSFRDQEHEQEILNGPIECGFEVEMVWTKKIKTVKVKPTSDDIIRAFGTNKLPKLYATYPDIFTQDIINDTNEFLKKEYEDWVGYEKRSEMRSLCFRIMHSDDPKNVEGINKFIDEMWEVRSFKNSVQNYWKDTASTKEKSKPIDVYKWAKKYIIGDMWYADSRFQMFAENNPDLFPEYAKQVKELSKSLSYKRFCNEYVEEDLLLFLDNAIPYLNAYEDYDDDDDFDNKIAGLKLFMKDDWIKQNSMFKEVSDNPNTKAWHFHYDGSIVSETGRGIPVEISSPVFPTPNTMLTEMASLFNYLIANKAQTNETTGLHVTMSYRGPTQKYNKVKIVLLLNDNYWLEKFNRQNNSYASSQIDGILPNIDLRKALILKDTQLKQLEKLILPTIGTDKYYAVHFKKLENIDKNKLVEFRILGNKDYEQQYDEVKKAVTQYAGVMEAGYNPEAFKDEYNEELRKILQIIKQSGEKHNEFKQLIKRLMQSIGDAPDKLKRNLSAFVEPQSDIGTTSFLYPLLDWLTQSIRSNKLNSSNFTAEDQKLFASILKQKQLDGIAKQHLKYSANRTELEKIEKLLFGSAQ